MCAARIVARCALCSLRGEGRGGAPLLHLQRPFIATGVQGHLCYFGVEASHRVPLHALLRTNRLQQLLQESARRGRGQWGLMCIFELPVRGIAGPAARSRCL